MPLKAASDQVGQSPKPVPHVAKARRKRPPTLKLTAGIIIIAFALSWLGDIAVKQVLVPPYLGIAEQSIAAMLFFALGWGGVIAILRREFYQVTLIRGRPAVVIGVVIAGVCWLLSLRLLWNVALETWRLFAIG